MTSPWSRSARPSEVEPDEFRFEINQSEVNSLINHLRTLTDDPEHGFYILLAALCGVAFGNDLTKDDLIEMLTEEIIKMKIGDERIQLDGCSSSQSGTP